MEKKIVSPAGAPAPIGPYSPGVKIGGFLYTSGQIGVNPATGTLEGYTLEQEIHQVMQNLQRILAAEGYTFEHVIKTTIFLKNMDDFAKVNEVYGSYFKEGNYPARETVQVARLPKDVNVEISMIAYKP
ncbi:MAG: RidA family protein [Bacteroidia bacterium]|nr:RidA family protein [Bacteroidia bacterium]MDW8159473.1 RidA family protein [Bacteroidia bacterium]